MDATTLRHSAARGRHGVSAVFFMNGFITGSWAPQIPVVMGNLGISEFTLGLLILLFGLGAIASMSWCGYLIARHGATAVLRAFAVAGTISLLLVVLAPGLPLAAAAMILFGGVIGGMDVAMNANGVAVEKKRGRAIMSSLHGFWSLGGFAGGALGGFAIERAGQVQHAVGVTLLAAAIVAWALPRLLGDQAPAQAARPRIGLPKSPLIYAIGVMALFSMVPEGAVLDWSALYLRQELGSDVAVSGFAFAAFSATMALVRFMGDAVRDRLGAVTTLRVSSLVAAAGILGAGLAPSPWLAIAAFAFSGLGIANMVPIAFSAAGNQKDVSTGAGMSVVTTMGYSGILAAPSLIGFVGGHVGFGPVYVAVSALLVVVFLMARLAASADFTPPDKG
ncbi:MAG: MFS transporter [Rhizobiaceae bacterium]